MILKSTTIIFLAYLFTMPVIVFACDYDGTCQSGETRDNCVFDCWIATNTKDIKILSVNYGTEKATQFHIDGSSTVYTGIEFKNFLLSNIDFSVDGRLWINNDHVYVDDLTNDIPVVMYKEGGYWAKYLLDYPSHPLYPWHVEAQKHDDWFLHQQGQAKHRETRISHNTEIEWYHYNWTNADLRSSFTAYVKSYFTINPGIDGMFYDETIGYINTSLNCGGIIESKPVQDDGAGNKFILVSNAPNTSMCINPVTIKNALTSENYNVEGVWETVKKIYLQDNTVPSGTNVIVNYWVNPGLPQEYGDSAEPDISSGIAEMFNLNRQKVPGKLIIYNGCSSSRNYDSSFMQYSDGCSAEGWSLYSANETSWKTNIDKLSSVSKNKIYLALAGRLKDISESEMQKNALFSFCSFLLGKEKYAYYTHGTNQHFYFFDYWRTPLGQPLEPYHFKGNFSGANIYEREYEKALVLVNPGETNSGNINLGSTYKTLVGSLVTSISLSSKEGILLQKILSSTCSLPGDINGDNQVDSLDLNIAINIFLNIEIASSQPCPSQADFNSDGQIDISDIQQIINLMS